ncbi:tryptophan synthase beta subunit-like PLP-dependent enzyme [Whalleya microplaca]|nr:tryptophan synthase beta subunit-like PLP-dependent enzyme [Whalleya microplaca]
MPSPSIHLNPTAAHPPPSPASDTQPHPDPGPEHPTPAAILTFHQALPSYAPTPLRALPSLARDLGLAGVFLKDEGARCGLPAFKILGASWAVWRAVGERLGLSAPIVVTGDGRDGGMGGVGNMEGGGGLSIEDMGAMARDRGIAVLTLTEGNCGRAVARMAAGYLGVETRVYVPALVPEGTRELIRGEGAEVVEVEGCYDEVVGVVVAEARRRERGGEEVVLVLDVGVEGYEEVPGYFVEGYTTMLTESTQQLLSATGWKSATHAIVPVGAGSIGEAVTAYFKDATTRSSSAKVIAVEPTTAACLQASLKAGTSVSVPTADTIMCGMNCGTLSTTAWPVLRTGVDASVTVTDAEAHAAVEELSALGVLAGPCGAATLAALRRVCMDAKGEFALDGDSVVVLYCTEGARDYAIPE